MRVSVSVAMLLLGSVQKEASVGTYVCVLLRLLL